jgi:hypothetical protein
MKKILFVLAVSFFGQLCFALTCNIKLNSENQFPQFENGRVDINLNQGYVDAHSAKAFENLISSRWVSLKRAPTESCTLNHSKDYSRTGDLKSFRFYFEDCQLSLGKKVLASVSYNFATNRGVYQEVIITGSQYRIASFFLSDCRP